VARARAEPGGEIGPGLCVLLGVGRGDSLDDAERLAGTIARLRIFENEEGRFDRSLLDTGGAALVVSQFTLIADSTRQKGTRPDFSKQHRRLKPSRSTRRSATRCARSASRLRPASSAPGCSSSSSTTGL
jgi:D-tyrosyl-tRNA(Tyr) deacylase